MSTADSIRKSFELEADREALELAAQDDPCWEEVSNGWIGEAWERIADIYTPKPPTRLAVLRGMNYRGDYLRSPEWRRTRENAIAAAGHECHQCGERDEPRRPLDVHHLSYERLGHELPEDLVVLCRPCHQEKHYEGAE